MPRPSLGQFSCRLWFDIHAFVVRVALQGLFFPPRALPVLVPRDFLVFASQMAHHRLLIPLLFLSVFFAVYVTPVTVYGCWLSITHYADDCRPLRVSTPPIHTWQCRVAVDQGNFSGLSFLYGSIRRVNSVQKVSFLRQLERTRRPPIFLFRLPHVCFGTAPPHNTSSLHYRSDFQGFLTADRTDLIIRDRYFREVAACKYARQSCLQTSYVRFSPLAFYWHAPDALISGTTFTINQTSVPLALFLCYNLTHFYSSQCAVSATVRQALTCIQCRALIRAGIRYRDTHAIVHTSSQRSCHPGPKSSLLYLRSTGSFSLVTNAVTLPHVAAFPQPHTICEYHVGCCSGSGFTAAWSFPPIPGQCLLNSLNHVTVNPPSASALLSAASWHLTVAGWTAEWRRCPLSLRLCHYSPTIKFCRGTTVLSIQPSDIDGLSVFSFFQTERSLYANQTQSRLFEGSDPSPPRPPSSFLPFHRSPLFLHPGGVSIGCHR